MIEIKNDTPKSLLMTVRKHFGMLPKVKPLKFALAKNATDWK